MGGLLAASLDICSLVTQSVAYAMVEQSLVEALTRLGRLSSATTLVARLESL